MLDLSDEEYRSLSRLAEGSGSSPSEWAMNQLRPHLASSQRVEAPETLAPELVPILRGVAESSGRDYDDVVAAFLRSTALRPRPKVSEAEAAAAWERLFECTVDLGYATGIDNESIDADLAREYDNNHECVDELPPPRPTG